MVFYHSPGTRRICLSFQAPEVAAYCPSIIIYWVKSTAQKPEAQALRCPVAVLFVLQVSEYQDLFL